MISMKLVIVQRCCAVSVKRIFTLNRAILSHLFIKLSQNKLSKELILYLH